MKKKIIYFVKIIIVLFILLFLYEIILRLFCSVELKHKEQLFMQRYTSWQARYDSLLKRNIYAHTDTLRKDSTLSYGYRKRAAKDSSNAKKILFIGDSMLDGFNDDKTKPIDYYLDSILLHEYTIYNCSKSSIALEHQKLYEEYFDQMDSYFLKIRTICMFDDFIPDLFLETKIDSLGNKFITLNDSKYMTTQDAVYQTFPWMKSAVLQEHFYTPMAVYARYQMSKKPEIIRETTRYFSESKNTILLIIPPAFAIKENEWYMKILGYESFKENLIADLKSKNISYYFIDDLLDRNEISYQEDQTHFDDATNQKIAKILANRFLKGK